MTVTLNILRIKSDNDLSTITVCLSGINAIDRYDTTMKDFNVDSKAECDQINLAHVAREKI